MARYIDADKLKAHYAWWGDTEERRTFDEIVDVQPTADVQEVKHGKWINHITVFCSVCGRHSYGNIQSEYCPSCGAKMDGEEIENEGV